MDGVVFNEFAAVACHTDHRANGLRLRLEDVRTGRVRYLDALELETLVWLPAEWWDRLLDPAIRWNEERGVADEAVGDGREPNEP